MAGGFTSPAILFLNTWDAPERAFCKTVFEALAKDDQYTRYVEPCSGGFAMPLVAENAGWTGPEMEASDTSLFSSIVGTMLSDGDFADLGITLDGKPVSSTGTNIEQAAHLLWVQLLARTQVRPDVEYWRTLIADLTTRQDEHEAFIAEKLRAMYDRLGGLKYEPLDMWSHIERVADDPHTVISINPPTYKAGFEKFFDTKGRLEWKVPEYQIFDPGPDIPRLVQLMEGRAALFICQQQREPGNSAHPRPVFGRYLSAGQNVYINSNRPDEVFAITGGPKVGIRRSPEITPMALPIIPLDYDVQPDSKIDLVPVKAQVADYYRGLWMHRLNAQPGSLNLLMLVDGYVAGVMGYNPQSMQMPYQSDSKWARHIILRFAFGAPHDFLRLTRLATMVALQHATVKSVTTPTNALFLDASEGLVTIEYTRHPEAKGLRGLMKLADRTPHPDGYRLIYAADWTADTNPVTMQKFVEKEKQWRASRPQ